MQPLRSNISDDTQEIFRKFPDLPYDVRHLIWESCLPGPRIITVKSHINKAGRRQWKTQSPRPAILGVCRESRRIAKRRYQFCNGPDMCLWLNPSIDTLYFGQTGSDLDLVDFLIAANKSDVNALKRLAIDEMHLAAWGELSKQRDQLLANALLPIMGSLEKFMVGIQVPSLDYYPNIHLAPDEWEGWLFGGGPLTAEEKLIRNGGLPELLFSRNSLERHLFHLTEAPEYPNENPGVYPLSMLKLFSFYYPLQPEARGRRREAVARLGPWYRRIYRRMAQIDVKLTRLFEMVMLQSDCEGLDRSYEVPQVACFVRPAESFRDWEDSLKPLCEAEWDEDRELISHESRGRVK